MTAVPVRAPQSEAVRGPPVGQCLALSGCGRCQLSFRLPWPGSGAERRHEVNRAKLHKPKSRSVGRPKGVGQKQGFFSAGVGPCPPRRGHFVCAPAPSRPPLRAGPHGSLPRKLRGWAVRRPSLGTVPGAHTTRTRPYHGFGAGAVPLGLRVFVLASPGPPK